MNIDAATPFHYAQRALTHVQILAKSGRGSATAAEKQAAEYVQAQLTSLVIEDIQVQPFSGERSLWLFVAFAFGLALVGHAAYWLLRKPVGQLPALIIALAAFGFSSYLVYSKFAVIRLEENPFLHALPHAPSQNVIARIAPAQQASHRLVLVAHLDTHRAVFWFASNLLVQLFKIIAFLTTFGVFAAIPVYILAAFTPILVFDWLGLALLFLHFVGWFTGVTADLGRYSPGANDNASAVGTVLSLAERLKAQPLQNTEVWLAFTGCEETSGDGMLNVVKEYGEQLKDAMFLDFEMVGIGDQVSYIRQEGNIRRFTIPHAIEELVKEVGQPFGIQPIDTPVVGASTECNILLNFGFKAVCLVTYRSGTSFMPEWHRLTDTPDKLELTALERVHNLAWALLQRLDQ